MLAHILRLRQADDPPDTNPSNPPPANPAPHDDDHDLTGSSSHAWAWFILALFVLVVVVLLAWFVYSHLRARRLGLPPPALFPFRSSNRTSRTPAHGSSWFSKLRGRRAGARHTSAYETTRGARTLDPDEAWDARVDHEADAYGPYGGGVYEEQELGLRTHAHHARHESELSYTGPSRSAGYGPASGLDEIAEQRGRSPQRELDERYAAATGQTQNPFGDDAAVRAQDPFGDEHAADGRAPLRGLSPRPDEERRPRTKDHAERRSIFHEEV